jgi:hypothetical protein
LVNEVSNQLTSLAEMRLKVHLPQFATQSPNDICHLRGLAVRGDSIAEKRRQPPIRASVNPQVDESQ